MIRFLFSKVFFINLFVAIVLIASVLWYVLNYLDDYTLHGESITVPDLKGYAIADLDTFLNEKKLRYLISDSVYNKKMKRGVVIEQDPKPDARVKENRTIYLIVNAMLAQKVKMPNLVDLSLRQAITTLETYGFIVGELVYAPDFARDAVIGQKIDGEDIEPGKTVLKGAVVDLVMGMGESDELVPVPLLIGLSLEDALSTLKKSSLNSGGVKADETVVTSTDSIEARVYKQNPNYGIDLINLGGYVDIWLTKDPNKVELDALVDDDDGKYEDYD